MSTGETLLSIAGINKRFGGIQALTEVGADIHAGSIHGLIGPNGAGKTTLFNVVTGFLKPDSGSVKFRGAEMVGLPPYKIARAGLVRTFQGVKPLSELRVTDNILAGAHCATNVPVVERLFKSAKYIQRRDATRRRVEDLLAHTGLAAKARMMASELSFGELRFLEIARAIAAEPAVLMLDEPAAGLNREEVNRLADLLSAMRDRNLTIILIEHDVELVFKLCDRVTVLEFGKVLCTEPPSTARQDPAVIAAYLGDELEESDSSAKESQQ